MSSAVRYFIGENDDKDKNIAEQTKTEQKHEKNVKRFNFKDKRKELNAKYSERRKKYERGQRLVASEASYSKKHRESLGKTERNIQRAVEISAQTELLLNEDKGYLEADDNEFTYQIKQKEIVSAVDITSATKHFDLDLHFGPYSMNYYRNGRQLLIGGKRGHVAAIDWVTKDLICEFNVQESVHDIQWLHMPTMFAVAQKDWVHIYDNKGIEIHCLKKLYRIIKLDFLQYHFLLVSASDSGYLSWLDVSTGELISNFRSMKNPRITSMKQNPNNAIIATSHPNGVLQMWSPNDNQPLVSMLCHPTSIRDIAFDTTGVYMATASADRGLKIWDIRNYKCLQDYKLRSTPSYLDISERNLLAVSIGNVVEIYKDCFTQTVDVPYLRHRLNTTVWSLEFCNYEDILGIGKQTGFTSILVPGSGEPNFDSFESNPYMTKSQKREMEVKALLEKIQPQLISLDAKILGNVNIDGLRQQIKDKQNIRYVKPKKIEFESKIGRRRQRTAKKAAIKRGLQQQQKRTQIKQIISEKGNKKEFKKDNDVKNHVLDRFKPKI